MNPLNILEIPRLKLAGTYLAIIMGMSLVFSFAIYNISDRELRSQRALEVPSNLPLQYISDFERLRDIRYNEAISNVRERLIFFNFITLICGGILSYALAIRALKPIEEAMETQARFTSDASHEIRTPLTVMKSEIEVALRDKQLKLSEAKETLTSNLEEITKLEALTSGLLQLSRQENITVDKRKIPMLEMITNAVALVEPSAHKKHIKISKIILKDFSINADPASFQQVVVILLDNAVKYSPEKSEVAIQAKNSRLYHNIIIQDHGPGIDPEDLPHIFERFYRSDKSRTKKQSASGYGLGLAIAKQIIDAHGGAINITSRLGTGTKAVIQLPKK